MKKLVFSFFVLTFLFLSILFVNCSKNSTGAEDPNDTYPAKLFKAFLTWANSTYPPIDIEYDGTWYYKENILENRTEWTFQNSAWQILIIEFEDPEKNKIFRIYTCDSTKMVLSAIQNPAGVFIGEFFEFAYG